MRGNHFHCEWRAATWGLSPRMRGNRTRPPLRTGQLGSIPAYAGEPGHRGAVRRRRRVYPRVCGGTTVGDGLLGHRIGLSPRMRGNPAQNRRRRKSPGSIPAYAGEPGKCTSMGYCRRVYPRVCGGTRNSALTSSHRRGLSPRMRGNHDGTCSLVGTSRSIPAYAGEPTAERRGESRTAVYPRVCGGTFHWGLASSLA